MAARRASATTAGPRRIPPTLATALRRGQGVPSHASRSGSRSALIRSAAIVAPRNSPLVRGGGAAPRTPPRRIPPLWGISARRILISSRIGPPCIRTGRHDVEGSAKRTEAGRDLNTMSFSEPDTEILVPSLDVRALARRAAVPAALAAVAAARSSSPAARSTRSPTRSAARSTPIRAGSSAARSSSCCPSPATSRCSGWSAAARASASDFRASTQVTLGGAAATRLLPTGGVGGAALTIWSFRRAGLGARGATRTLLALPRAALLGLPRRDRAGRRR